MNNHPETSLVFLIFLGFFIVTLRGLLLLLLGRIGRGIGRITVRTMMLFASLLSDFECDFEN